MLPRAHRPPMPAPTRRRRSASSRSRRSRPRTCRARRRQARRSAGRCADRFRGHRRPRPGVSVTTTSWAAASSRVPTRQSSSPAGAARGSVSVSDTDALGEPDCLEATGRPGAVYPAADDPGAPAQGRPMPVPIPPRPRRSEARSRPRSRAPRRTRRCRSPKQARPRRRPVDRGRGSRGNDVTHLTIARPAPIAGIARKSPCGGASR